MIGSHQKFPHWFTMLTTTSSPTLNSLPFPQVKTCFQAITTNPERSTHPTLSYGSVRTRTGAHTTRSPDTPVDPAATPTRPFTGTGANRHIVLGVYAGKNYCL